MSKTEIFTQDIVRKLLLDKGYTLVTPNSEGTILYAEDAYKVNPELKELLKNASKCDTDTKKLWTDEAEPGKPDFLIINKNSNLCVVIECKKDHTNHVSKSVETGNLRRTKEIASNAVDGALHYAKFLSKNYDVIAIGVSGTNENNLMIDSYIWSKGIILEEGKKGVFKNIGVNELLAWVDYKTQLDKNDIFKQHATLEQVMDYAKELNDLLNNLSVQPADRALLVSGLLIALQSKTVLNSYAEKDLKLTELKENILAGIKHSLSNSGIVLEKQNRMLQQYAVVIDTDALIKNKNGYVPIVAVLSGLQEKIIPCMTNDTYIDIIGKFFNEFLRYAKGDTSSGIVLTPPHITELFCDLVDLQVDDIVLDPCSGTGGFLVAAMGRMFSKANDEKTKDNIRKNQLIGCENDAKMFALGCANMILRGDGKANMYYGDSLDMHSVLSKHKATIGFINPPYSDTNHSCLEFIHELCDNVAPRSKVSAIVPISYAFSQKEKILAQKKQLLSKNRLIAVISMPVDLFLPVKTVTCIMIFETGIPHDSNIPTYLGNWKDDGYVWNRNLGRIPNTESHLELKEKWLKSFKGKMNDDLCFMKCLTFDMDWIWEAYAETDYSKITEDLFKEELKKYAVFKMLSETV